MATFKTTIQQEVRVWQEQEIYFEAESLEAAKSMTADQIASASYDWGNVETFWETEEVIASELPDDAEIEPA